MARLNSYIDDILFKSAKVQAATEGITLTELTEKAFIQYLSHDTSQQIDITTEDDTSGKKIPMASPQTSNNKFKLVESHRCEHMGCHSEAIGKFRLYYHQNNTENISYLCKHHKEQAALQEVLKEEVV